MISVKRRCLRRRAFAERSVCWNALIFQQEMLMRMKSPAHSLICMHELGRWFAVVCMHLKMTEGWIVSRLNYSLWIWLSGGRRKIPVFQRRGRIWHMCCVKVDLCPLSRAGQYSSVAPLLAVLKLKPPPAPQRVSVLLSLSKGLAQWEVHTSSADWASWLKAQQRRCLVCKWNRKAAPLGGDVLRLIG